MVMPNAGMPELVGNKAVYKMTAEKFGAFAKKFADMGVNIIGGCCGTGPAHIKAVVDALKPEKQEPPRLAGAGSVRFASRTRVVEVKAGTPLLVGERINPTGRPLFQAEIKAGKTAILRQEAQAQVKADLLDVNVSVPDTSESESMGKAVKLVQTVTDQPLSIDSPNRFAIEAGLKQFCGRALLNSVNGKRESLDNVLPLAKKYGAAIIALALDEHGLPQTADDRVRIAEKIVQAAVEKGLAKEAVFVDGLVMTAGVGIHGCLETLKAISLIRERLGVKTILGISNVSHGLPNRSKLNSLYLQLAISYGLDAAIVDVTDPAVKKVIAPGRSQGSREALLQQFKNEVDKARRSGKPAEKKREAVIAALKYKSLKDIERAVIDGDQEKVALLVDQALAKKVDPQKIIDRGLIPGMETVGKKFSRKEYFLPQVIEAAEAMRQGFTLAQARIPAGKKRSAGKVILATVKGDIHDIGKNIVKMLLENNGFSVIDLGKDVPPEAIIESARKEKPNAIALSALLTTTMVEMGIVKAELKKAKLDIPLLVGGAVVTKGYADRIGATYSMDAVGAVAMVKAIIKAAKK
jgi:5-methyltetrahydrofolate--homocysteine methyltransferase